MLAMYMRRMRNNNLEIGLWAPLVARKNYTGSGLGPEGGVIAVAYLGEGPRGTAPSPFFRPNEKNFGDQTPSLSQDLDYRPPTFLSVWICHWVDTIHACLF